MAGMIHVFVRVAIGTVFMAMGMGMHKSGLKKS
jgi:hypothetical protein